MDEGSYPAPNLIFRELTSFMRAVEGHNNRKGKAVDDMWDSAKGKKWPEGTVYSLTEAEKWGLGTTLKEAPKKKKAAANKDGAGSSSQVASVDDSLSTDADQSSATEDEEDQDGFRSILMRRREEARAAEGD